MGKGGRREAGQVISLGPVNLQVRNPSKGALGPVVLGEVSRTGRYFETSSNFVTFSFRFVIFISSISLSYQQ